MTDSTDWEHFHDGMCPAQIGDGKCCCHVAFIHNLEAERDRYKADWEKLMAAIGPYSTTDIAAKMAQGCHEREARYKAALATIVGEAANMDEVILVAENAKHRAACRGRPEGRGRYRGKFWSR